MTNNRVFNQIEDVMEEINTHIDDMDIEDESAIDILSNLTESGGGIEVINTDEFEPVQEPTSNIVTRIDSEYSLAYGLDGSTTKDLSFNNGLVISVSLASMCTTRGRRDSNMSGVGNMSDKTTVSIATHFSGEDVHIDPESTDKTKIYYNQFPSVNKNSSEVPDWITNISRTQAEGSHFKQISDEIDGPLFVDGPLLPPGVLIWILYDQVGNSDGKPTDYKPDLIAEILQNYIDGMENCILNENPVFGVQKTTSSNRVLNALKMKGVNENRLKWSNDGSLFNSALDIESEDKTEARISYTPWYMETKYDIGGRHGLITPLDNYEKINLPDAFEDSYRKRLFFFAKPPTDPTVYRIGIPKALQEFTRYSLDELRDIALNEMVCSFREPLPVVVADKKVRIPEHVRNKFRKLINSKPHIGKNEQRNQGERQ